MPCGQPGLCLLRNKDLQEVTLEREGQVLLHFAAAYGFRNIQNLVQKLKRGRCPYHYVEVMACPAGSCRQSGPSGTPCADTLPLTTLLPVLLCHRLLEWWRPAQGPRHAWQGASAAG